MSDREYVVTFEGDDARIELVPRDKPWLPGNVTAGRESQGDRVLFVVRAPDSRRAEQIARAMRKPR